MSFRIFIGFLFLLTCAIVHAQENPQEPDSNVVDTIGYQEEQEIHESALEFVADSFFSTFERNVDFYFDTSLIPSRDLYPFWDSLVIDPYRENLAIIGDSVDLILTDSDDCFFYPPCTNPITSGFGYRRWGRSVRYHFGIDLGLKTGDPVYAAWDGIIRMSLYSPSYGYMVVIRHYNGLETLYGHFSKLLVYAGQTVRAGDRIGLGGSTGWSTGAHLHFEVRYKGKPIDPSQIISFERKCLIQDTLHIRPELFAHLKPPPAYQPKTKSGMPARQAAYHRVKKGETLYSIAYKYRTTVNAICRLNRISKNTRLKPGRTIRVR